MHFFFGGFCLLAERGNLVGHICGFEQVLKAKVLAFGTFAKSFFAFQGTKLFFFAQSSWSSSRRSTKGVENASWKLFGKNLIIDLPWWYHGEVSGRRKTREFCEFFVIFCTSKFFGAKVVFSSDYCFWHSHKHKVSRTIKMTTFSKVSDHESSMVVPWGRNK